MRWMVKCASADKFAGILSTCLVDGVRGVVSCSLSVYGTQELHTLSAEEEEIILDTIMRELAMNRNRHE